MSSVLFLAHRSRAHVLTRASSREERGMRRERWRGAKGKKPGCGTSMRAKRWYEGGEGERRKRARRSEESKSRGRFARERAHARWESEGWYAAAPAKRIGEDRTRWAARERGRDIGRREQNGWTRKARANLFALFGGRDRQLVSIRHRRSDINARILRGIIPR